MKKSTKAILTFCLSCMMIISAGCSEQVVKEPEKKLTEPDRKKEDDHKTDQPKEEEEKRIIVKVIDSLTNVSVKTFTPAEMEFGRDDEKYRAEVEAFAKEIARGTENKPGYDQRMIPDRIDQNGNIIKGQPRIILEEAELVEKIIEASAYGGEVELPIYMTASGYSEEEVPHLGETVVATYTTYFNNNVIGRTKNIELSAKAIDQIILGAGDVFSFNTTLGPSDEAHGYQPAEEIVNGELVMGIGGGICQTSSTLYNAIDFLGVEYIEKHHHSLEVGYVPKGRDATVSYGGKDFRFKNTTGVPFLLKAIVGKGSLTIEVRTSRQFEQMLKNVDSN